MPKSGELLWSGQEPQLRATFVCYQFIPRNCHAFFTEQRSNRSVCTGTKKYKLQISHDLGEFALQICILGDAICSLFPVCASLTQRAPPVQHTGLFAWWHLARVNLLRERAGDSLVRHISI
jgi:hypothetical protein